MDGHDLFPIEVEGPIMVYVPDLAENIIRDYSIHYQIPIIAITHTLK